MNQGGNSTFRRGIIYINEINVKTQQQQQQQQQHQQQQQQIML